MIFTLATGERVHDGDAAQVGALAADVIAEAMAKHGPDAKVIVLPFARYQLPRNMVRMDAEPLRYPQAAYTR